MCYSIQVDKDIKKMAEYFEASYSNRTEDFFLKESGEAKIPDADNRVYKNTYSPVIIFRKGRREIVPLRYNLLPGFSETDKYQFFNHKKNKYEELSTYNAKIENIEKTKAFEHLFMKNHCIIPIKSFYEWVNRDGKKQQLEFYSKNKNYLFAAGIWDHWGPMNLEEGINSFAIITTPPRVEVQEAGHQRSPLLLNENSIDQWIKPENSSKIEIYDLVKRFNQETLLNKIV